MFILDGMFLVIVAAICWEYSIPLSICAYIMGAVNFFISIMFVSKVLKKYGEIHK